MKRNLCIKFTNLSKHDCKLKFEIWHAARLRAVVHAGLCACHVCVCASVRASMRAAVSPILLCVPHALPLPMCSSKLLCNPECSSGVFHFVSSHVPHRVSQCAVHVSSPNFHPGHAAVRPSMCSAMRPSVRPSVCPSVRAICVLLRVLLVSSRVSSCVPPPCVCMHLPCVPQFSIRACHRASFCASHRSSFRVSFRASRLCASARSSGVLQCVQLCALLCVPMHHPCVPPNFHPAVFLHAPSMCSRPNVHPGMRPCDLPCVPHAFPHESPRSSV